MNHACCGIFANFFDDLDDQDSGKQQRQAQFWQHDRDHRFEKEDDDLSQSAEVKIKVEIKIEEAIFLDWNEPYQEMEIRVEEIFDE